MLPLSSFQRARFLPPPWTEVFDLAFLAPGNAEREPGAGTNEQAGGFFLSFFPAGTEEPASTRTPPEGRPGAEPGGPGTSPGPAKAGTMTARPASAPASGEVRSFIAPSAAVSARPSHASNASSYFCCASASFALRVFSSFLALRQRFQSFVISGSFVTSLAPLPKGDMPTTVQRQATRSPSVRHALASS